MKKAIKGAIVAGAAVVALGGGMVLGGFVGANAASWSEALESQDGYSGNDNFHLNENGQTFGASRDASSAENEPDLILAYGKNPAGETVLGYVAKADLVGPENLTPEEAGRLQEEQGTGDREIPVYDSDGKTVIGVFVVTGGGQTSE